MMYGDHMNGWGYGFMTVGMLLFWALLIFTVILLVRYLPGRDHRPPQPPPPPPDEGAEQILAERFARGEIDEQEYRHRLAVLRNETTPTS
jgi:putative membrane protein